MKKLFTRLLSFFNSIRSQIAFYPTLFAFLGFLFSALTLYLESLGISDYIREEFPSIIVNNGDTALSVLGAIITGLISMMVFSFSMVMVLLNQASTNYSPRLLPGLISDRKHQTVLGVYLATILYCIFIMVAINPDAPKKELPGFSVFLGIVFTVFCMGAFIYFIHNISKSIQVNNILDNIYNLSKNRLQTLLKSEAKEFRDFPDSGEWYTYKAEESGYFQNISITNLLDLCEELDTKLHILPVKGIFILKGIPVLRSEQKIDKEKLDEVLANFNFAREELVADNYVLAFKQLTEIIAKAMSPGINDPGTAINAIDYLTELLGLRMQKKDSSVISREEKCYLKLNTVDFKSLLYNVLVTVRTYCSHDLIIIQKISLMFEYLLQQEQKEVYYKKLIKEEAKTFFESGIKAIESDTDIALIKKLAKNLNIELSTT
ncbi:DUF2254 domain-containing protein [Zunongwangia endophytica]|uniref:DUF2254 domain-containing protein n=1 Tax=Zunongwangia endophytica TaxID=1808945 RepID=A0ABV8H9G0_9FLAO|nr:DUF2254 domain-containing protein [Zunongwangia endophytica]MDN3594925.1 DUF2254 domain-containing protein [Zunongwangia endophytica]